MNVTDFASSPEGVSGSKIKSQSERKTDKMQEKPISEGRKQVAEIVMSERKEENPVNSTIT